MQKIRMHLQGSASLEVRAGIGGADWGVLCDIREPEFQVTI